MHKKLILAILLLFTVGCQSLPELCRHVVLSQHAAAVERWGKENAQIWRMKNAYPRTYKYHAQVRVRPGGPGTKWSWVPNRLRKEFLSDRPQTGCTPYKRIK